MIAANPRLDRRGAALQWLRWRCFFQGKGTAPSVLGRDRLSAHVAFGVSTCPRVYRMLPGRTKGNDPSRCWLSFVRALLSLLGANVRATDFAGPCLRLALFASGIRRTPRIWGCAGWHFVAGSIMRFRQLPPFERNHLNEPLFIGARGSRRCSSFKRRAESAIEVAASHASAHAAGATRAIEGDRILAGASRYAASMAAGRCSVDWIPVAAAQPVLWQCLGCIALAAVNTACPGDGQAMSGTPYQLVTRTAQQFHNWPIRTSPTVGNAKAFVKQVAGLLVNETLHFCKLAFACAWIGDFGGGVVRPCL